MCSAPLPPSENFLPSSGPATKPSSETLISMTTLDMGCSLFSISEGRWATVSTDTARLKNADQLPWRRFLHACPTGKSVHLSISCPAPPRKIFWFSEDPNQFYISCHPVPHKGAF